MSYCSEPRLEPPEDVEIDTCYGCGYEIYLGEKHWRHDGHSVCLDCIKEHIGHKFGFDLVDGRE